MYSKILVALDGSETAEQVLPYARLLAKGLRIRVELVRVLEPLPLALVEVSYSVAQDTARLRRQAEEYLSALANRLYQDDDVPVTSLLLEGSPASAIIHEAAKDPATLIAMATHGRSGVTRWALGSVTDKVLHVASNPLIIIRALAHTPSPNTVALKRVIVPLDGSPTAEEALPHALALAKPLGLTMTLLRVVPTAADYYRYVGLVGGPYMDIAREADEEASRYLEQTAQQMRALGAPPVEPLLCHGPPADAVVDTSKQFKDNLIGHDHPRAHRGGALAPGQRHRSRSEQRGLPRPRHPSQRDIRQIKSERSEL
ncbi:MAG: universal stress protein [Chloroflexi bacterium]|nr:universal stress protein [Chloroflexota bacterium]